jgi:HEXXH motif-containing protein
VSATGVATWRIDTTAARRATAAYGRALNRRLAAATGDDRSERLAAQTTWSLPEQAWLLAHSLCDGGLDRANTHRARALIADVAARPRPATRLVVDPEALWVADAVATIDGDLRAAGTDCSLRAGSVDPAGDRSTLDGALALLWRCWPEAALECELLVREVVPVTGRGLANSSLPKAFGAVFVASGRGLVDTFDALVHETGHHSLIVKTAFAPHLANGKDLASSPLRSDARPLLGTLHAVFVLVRVATALGRVLDHLDGSDRRAAAALVAGYELSIDEGLRTLARRARPTPAGALLLADLAGRSPSSLVGATS